MAIKMVREPSETPNINNIDDIVPMRYAYGGQNGYVIGKGTEISNTVNGLNFTVNSGRLVLQGVECDIDATGVTITIDNIATKRYYTIYLEVNLGLNTATIKSEYDTATYPTIDDGDDLTENTTGIARLPLYKFTATSGIISEVNKVVESVKYTKEIKVDNASKINGVEIKQDENGVLKIGDIIIPQKKLIHEGDVVENGTITLTNNPIQQGDVLEFVIFRNYAASGVGYDTTLRYRAEVKSFEGNENSPIQALKSEVYNFDSSTAGHYSYIQAYSNSSTKITYKGIVSNGSLGTGYTVKKIYKIVE